MKENQRLTPAEIIENFKDGYWKYLGPNRLYQRLLVTHHCYGEVVLLIRRKNPCNPVPYPKVSNLHLSSIPKT